jgi:hypothetical protein
MGAVGAGVLCWREYGWGPQPVRRPGRQAVTGGTARTAWPGQSKAGVVRGLRRSYAAAGVRRRRAASMPALPPAGLLRGRDASVARSSQTAVSSVSELAMLTFAPALLATPRAQLPESARPGAEGACSRPAGCR